MKHRLLCGALATFCASFIPSFSAQAETIYYNGFEGMCPGTVDDDEIKSQWSTRYAKGPDEGRTSITEEGYLGNGGRILYPEFSNGTSDSGSHWETDISAAEHKLFLSYWVKLDADFQCVKGGKLPGFAGSEAFPRGEYDWSARLMWREDCKLEWYIHDFALTNLDGEDPYRVFWDDFGEHARLIPGQWHHLELMLELNTPGQRDGRLQGWLDGEQVSDDWENSGVRDVGQEDVKINELFFSTFFGGSSAPVSQWQPTEDVYATFDEFTVSTERIGVTDDAWYENSGSMPNSCSTEPGDESDTPAEDEEPTEPDNSDPDTGDQGQEPSSEGETNPDIADDDSDTAPEVDPETNPETETETETETENDVEPETGPETGSETEPDTTVDTEPDTVSDENNQDANPSEQNDGDTIDDQATPVVVDQPEPVSPSDGQDTGNNDGTSPEEPVAVGGSTDDGNEPSEPMADDATDNNQDNSTGGGAGGDGNEDSGSNPAPATPAQPAPETVQPDTAVLGSSSSGGGANSLGIIALLSILGWARCFRRHTKRRNKQNLK